MNVRAIIEAALRDSLCEIEERNGILYIKTPYNQTWDMTVPKEVKHESSES